MQDLEDRVNHLTADMNIRVDDLERNLKNLAFNIQGFAPSKAEEKEMEKSRANRVTAKKKMLRGSTLASFMSVDLQKANKRRGLAESGNTITNTSTIEDLKVESSKSKVSSPPSPEPERNLQQDASGGGGSSASSPAPVPTLSTPSPASASPATVDEKGEEKEGGSQSMSPSPVPSPSASSQVSDANGNVYVSTAESKARATKRWKWALRQLKAKFIAKKISMTTARVRPGHSMGDRMNAVEDAVAQMQYELSHVKSDLGSEQQSMLSKVSSVMEELRQSMGKMETANASMDKKNKLMFADMKTIKDDLASSAREVGDLKNEIEEKVQTALASGSAAAGKKAMKKKQEGLLKMMIDDLQNLKVDVQAMMKDDPDHQDAEYFQVLTSNIHDVLSTVSEDPHSNESLQTVTALHTSIQDGLDADDKTTVIHEGVEVDSVGLGEGDTAAFGNTAVEIIDGTGAGERQKQRPTVRRAMSFRDMKTSTHKDPAALSRRATIKAQLDPALIEELSLVSGHEDGEVEDDMRKRMEGTGKRLTEVMSSFSNVGKLELAVRRLQRQVARERSDIDDLKEEANEMQSGLTSKADSSYMKSSLAEKADLAMVQGVLAELQSRQAELSEKVNPANMAKALQGQNVNSNAMDQLSANLTQTIMNFDRMKKDLNSKAGSVEVSSAINSIQSSMKMFISETFNKEELSSVLQNKVDKKDLKKLANALQGLEGPAHLVAGATKCLVCERPGFVEQNEAISAHMRYAKRKRGEQTERQFFFFFSFLSLIFFSYAPCFTCSKRI